MFKRLAPLLFAAIVAVGAFTISSAPAASPQPVNAAACDFGYERIDRARIFRFNLRNAQFNALFGTGNDFKGWATAFKMTGTICVNGMDAYADGGQVVTQVGINPNNFSRQDDTANNYSNGPFWQTINVDRELKAVFFYERSWTNILKGWQSKVKIKFTVDGQKNVTAVGSYIEGPSCGAAGCWNVEAKEFTPAQYDWD